jgi:NitT/TauT family transport system permease protein
VAIGYSISVVIGAVLGIAIGTFASIESFFEPQIGFLRYIPATALTPLFLLWLGIDESPKIWLIVVGTVFYNILMIADVARNVPRELLNASYTLGATRRTVVRRVILPHSMPGIVDVARINLAAAWLMLVVAELLAAQKGLAFEIIKAQRFRAVDTMFALLIVFGVIGLVSDVFLRWFRGRIAPWAKA